MRVARLGLVALALLLVTGGCYVAERHCDAPTIYPKSQPADVGVTYTPTCQGYTLDFDAQLWFTTSNEDAVKICSAGDTVTLIDPTHIRYVRADGSSLQFGPPVRQHQLGCA